MTDRHRARDAVQQATVRIGRLHDVDGLGPSVEGVVHVGDGLGPEQEGEGREAEVFADARRAAEADRFPVVLLRAPR
ncbi:hypothetical protein GCM10020000_37090 [Streptomyces olivoverticillatus]